LEKQMSEQTLFIVQPYQAKPHRLVPLSAQVFDDEGSARRAGSRLARFRAGVVVLSQTIDTVTARKDLPATLAVHGEVPGAWLERFPLGLKIAETGNRRAA
jgi:hypothetical protein